MVSLHNFCLVTDSASYVSLPTLNTSMGLVGKVLRGNSANIGPKLIFSSLKVGVAMGERSVER